MTQCPHPDTQHAASRSVRVSSGASATPPPYTVHLSASMHDMTYVHACSSSPMRVSHHQYRTSNSRARRGHKAHRMQGFLGTHNEPDGREEFPAVYISRS